MFGIYSGHSSPEASNALYRKNLEKGQTRLSIAFDLPTQTGYDSDHILARGEVGKVGVPICSIEDMETLFEGIPMDTIGTNMTINATAAWLLSLYIAAAERKGVSRMALSGTTQNDIFKEYLSRGTYIFPPRPSVALTQDIINFTVDEVPKWNPTNVCSYHLQEVGATPEQEVGFALANAIAILDGINVSDEKFPRVFGRISFFCNAGLRFIEEMCKMRAFGRLWDRIGLERYGVQDAAASAAPLQRSGELVGPDRGPAREQHLAHSPRSPRSHPFQERTDSLPAAACLERSPGPAAPLGSAALAAHAADSGV